MRIGKGQTVNVGRGKPERLKLGGSGENPQLIYLWESVHRPSHVPAFEPIRK